MTEGELIAEAEGLGDRGKSRVRLREQVDGPFEANTFQIVRKGHADESLKKIGAILVRVAEKPCQILEGQALVQVIPDELLHEMRDVRRRV